MTGGLLCLKNNKIGFGMSWWDKCMADELGACRMELPLASGKGEEEASEFSNSNKTRSQSPSSELPRSTIFTISTTTDTLGAEVLTTKYRSHQTRPTLRYPNTPTPNQCRTIGPQASDGYHILRTNWVSFL